jgi:hypothetical protein
MTDIQIFRGNQNLKKKGAEIEWTTEMVEEFIQCSKDPIYFAEKYIQIVHVDHGLIPIRLYDYQKDIIIKVTGNRRTCVVTARQAGKTTTAVSIILHYVLFNEYKTVALLANKGDAAREILDRIKIAYEALPKWLQQGVVEWNKGSVEFENGCKILAGSTSSSSIRGKSVSFLYIDETAFVENWDVFFSSVFPTISSGNTTKILLTSTPKGLNHFYKTCEGAKANRNGYQFTQVMWYDVPGRDEKWKQEQLEAMDFDYEKFAQENECEFLGSSGTLITGAKLKQLVYADPIKTVDDINIFIEPDPGKRYVLIADVSRGKGLDYSAFHVIDITEMPYKQVCTYRSNMITPVDYATVIFRTAIYYNEAFVMIEINDIGEQVGTILFEDLEYENMLLTENSGRSGKRLISGVSGFGGKADVGLRTTKPVKSIGCSMIKLLVEQDQILINDFDTIKEFSTFSKNKNSWEAEPGNHDDLVMGLVLFGWLSNQKFFKELTDINTVSQLKEMSEERMLEQLVPFGIIDDRNDVYKETVVVSTKGNNFLFSDHGGWVDVDI